MSNDAPTVGRPSSSAVGRPSGWRCRATTHGDLRTQSDKRRWCRYACFTTIIFNSKTMTANPCPSFHRPSGLKLRPPPPSPSLPPRPKLRAHPNQLPALRPPSILPPHRSRHSHKPDSPPPKRFLAREFAAATNRGTHRRTTTPHHSPHLPLGIRSHRCCLHMRRCCLHCVFVSLCRNRDIRIHNHTCEKLPHRVKVAMANYRHALATASEFPLRKAIAPSLKELPQAKGPMH